MGINIGVPDENHLSPRITVVGCGGAGGNAVNNMILSQLEGVEFVVANTDAQALSQSATSRRIQLGTNLTQGLGAGSRPDTGRAAAEESIDEIMRELEGAHMVFITAGMGGGTGTGAASVIARAARDAGILTVGVVTKPFDFEGRNRMRLAEEGITELQQYVDTLIIIPNQNLFRVANEKTTFADAFKMADDVLHAGVRGVTDLMVMPGLINLDFADIRTVMSEMGKAMMGTGEANGDRRAVEAAEAAISNPLLDDTSMRGARGVLINITGGMDMTLFEVDEAANRIRDEVDSDANIIFGSTFSQELEGIIRVSVVATGIDQEEGYGEHETTTLHVLDQEPAREEPLMDDEPQVVNSDSGRNMSPARGRAPGHTAQTQELAQAAQRAQRTATGTRPSQPRLADNPRGSSGRSAPPPPRGRDVRPPRRDDAPYVPPPPAEPETVDQRPERSARPEPEQRTGLFRGGMERLRGGRSGHPREQEDLNEAAPPQQAPRQQPRRTRDEEEPYQPQLAEPQQPAAPGDDDVLDIPAFLRRQAN